MADTVKTAISIEKVLFDEAEKTAAAMNITRSKLYSIALEKFLKEKENDYILREINKNYQVDDPEDKEILEMMRKHRNKALEVEEW